MPSERRFRYDGRKATRFHKPDDGDDRMNENEEDVVHAGIVSKSQKIPEFRPFLEFATDRLGWQSAIEGRFDASSGCGPTGGREGSTLASRLLTKDTS